MNRDEQQFIDQARAALDERSDQVSPHVAARLRQARHAAIASPYRRAMPMWMPALSTAMLVLVVAVAWFASIPQVESPTSLPVQQAAGDFEMLVHGEDLDLFADMDFTSGWSNGVNMRVSKFVVLLLSLLPAALPAVEEEQPSLELLEYLGNWDDANGSWIDPQLLLPAVLNDAEKDDETTDKPNDE